LYAGSQEILPGSEQEELRFKLSVT